MSGRVSVELGALSPPLKDQVPGLKDADILQADADAISRCYIRGLISESTATIARKRLMRDIAKALGGKP